MFLVFAQKARVRGRSAALPYYLRARCLTFKRTSRGRRGHTLGSSACIFSRLFVAVPGASLIVCRVQSLIGWLVIGLRDRSSEYSKCKHWHTWRVPWSLQPTPIRAPSGQCSRTGAVCRTYNSGMHRESWGPGARGQTEHSCSL